ncbi:cytoskeletal protein RodZ [Rhodococcus sp. 27YEA15]|uniref:hypothetical protein n=1 Tax=Rhodococcus sp. 27YEA15 TaxID=3156259 RepID=UPI003C7D9406
MKDKTVIVAAAVVAGISLTSGLVFGGAVGAFGVGGPVVTPPELVSTVSADTVAGIEPAVFYNSVTAPPVAIPPSPTWRVAEPSAAPRNQPLVVTTTAATTTATTTSTTSPSATSTTTGTSTPSTGVSTSSATTTTAATASPSATVTTGSTPLTVEITTTADRGDRRPPVTPTGHR